jgi:hypothetical protein
MDILLTASFKNGLWVNGLQQNIVFLAELLQNLGHNAMIAVNHPLDKCKEPPAGILFMEEHEMPEYTFDYILQTGIMLRDDSIRAAKEKNPRLKNVHVHYGNRLITDVEICASNKKKALRTYSVDEVWVSPHYTFSIPYLQTFYRSQRVFNIPYIWSPRYMDESLRYNSDDDKNIGIMEPNLNMTKNCLIPIYLVENVFRSEPDLFSCLRIHNSSKLKDKDYFKSLMLRLDIVKANRKAIFGPRIPMKELFKISNVIVSHQLLNSLNYVYLEAMYLDMPIIHNSEDIMEAGYFYPDYDINVGAEKLKYALKFHDDNLDDYRKKSKRVMDRFSPDSELVQDQYRSLIG